VTARRIQAKRGGKGEDGHTRPLKLISTCSKRSSKTCLVVCEGIPSIRVCAGKYDERILTLLSCDPPLLVWRLVRSVELSAWRMDVEGLCDRLLGSLGTRRSVSPTKRTRGVITITLRPPWDYCPFNLREVTSEATISISPGKYFSCGVLISTSQQNFKNCFMASCSRHSNPFKKYIRS
jgi:hypothetical protein